MKKALITGITGQDGSYLAEFLLSKGYEVHGMIRRASTFNTSRIDHIYKDPHLAGVRLHLHYGDLSDSGQLTNIIYNIKPDEIYHLGAQSHVRVSFDIPEYTGDITALGTTRILEAVRRSGIKCKFYQASSSEMYGDTPAPQNEDTPFRARSPYAAAKIYAYWMVRNYREGYNLFTCNGILFNHESVPKNSPLIVNINGKIDIIPIEDLFRAEKHRYEGILDEYKGALVWNGECWTKIIDGSCYRDAKKSLRLIQTREACYEATYEHICFDEENSEVKTKDFKVGDKVFRISFPESKGELKLDKRLSKFIGYLVGDGTIDDRGRIRLTGKDKQELIEIAHLVIEQFGWTYRLSTYGPGKFDNCKEDIWQLDINNDIYFGLWLRSYIYTKHSQKKKVPIFILNSDIETKRAFFDGYYLADGRNAGNERYKYKGFTTKSATLCLGLISIFRSFSEQTIKCKCEYKDGRRYYYVQFGTRNPSNKGKHLRKDLNEVIKVVDTVSPDGWFFDIQTESQSFATGPNLFKIHNSPRRGETFVTRKITRGVARIIAGKDKKLYLGNLEAKRDWGYAPDYVEAMWLMLQQDKPNDYVIGTGETHSVKEFLEEVFNYVGLDWKEYVEIDPRYFRPTEVELLLADSSKARKELNWSPRINFKELVKIMVDSDMELIGLESPGEGKRILKQKGIGWTENHLTIG